MLCCFLSPLCVKEAVLCLAVWAEQVCVLPKAATSQPQRVFVPPALFVLPLREGFEADRNHPRFFPGKPKDSAAL